jgi:DNA polymerase elongation subunit (family B)
MEKTKILFFDLETVGNWPTLAAMRDDAPEFYGPWLKRDAFFRERYENNRDMEPEALYRAKSGLQPEFSRVACASFGTFGQDGEKKMRSFTGTEHEILKSAGAVINNADKHGFKLCGHNIKRFDLPFLWKRMLVNGINPPNSVNNFNKKPWDVTAIDTAELWSNGAWQESFTSLETLTALFGIPSPKAEMQADKVHDEFWLHGSGSHGAIARYCEGDVIALMDVFDAINKTGAL